MQKRSLLCISILLSISTLAQVPEDVLKYSWQPTNGTARINAVGGAMGSLGGDISALFVNPAGIGFFKTGEIVLSPGFNFLNNKSSYRGTAASDNGSNFNLGASGVVGGWRGSGRWSSKAIGFAVTRTANFSNKIYYTGKNDFSSYAEQYAAQAAASGLSLDEILGSNNVSLGTRMAVYTYLIDTATLGGNAIPDVVALPLYDQLKNGGTFMVDQANTIETSGGITELAIGYAANMDDKLYIGGSIGIPIISYEKKSLLREEDATGITDNYFSFSELSEKLTTKGVGVNLKLGVIMKPAEFVRLGLAVHTPNFYSLEDRYEATMSVNTENYRTNPGTETVSSSIFTNGETPEYSYELTTPWKFMLSGSYVLREVEDVRNQKGFLTADVEYVTYTSNKLRTSSSYDSGSEENYYKGVNEVIKDYYKGAFNFRVGGELKFTTIMTRLGFSYYTSPYKDKELKGSKMYISGGLGYRNAGFFVDLTYMHGIQKDVNFPYRLPDKANTYASVKGSGGNVMLTVGFKI
ncbi:MAG TPA: aromatic hydrocarbon degradation protein [Chitinophagaceae bacterium]|nr:aromatic hydrocarbon degradation protein [Chitinophagaceae bacterium]